MRGSTPGAPLRTLADLQPGTYNVQAALNACETLRRADRRDSLPLRLSRKASETVQILSSLSKWTARYAIIGDCEVLLPKKR
jgi:hypothetical protein